MQTALFIMAVFLTILSMVAGAQRRRWIQQGLVGQKVYTGFQSTMELLGILFAIGGLLVAAMAHFLPMNPFAYYEYVWGFPYVGSVFGPKVLFINMFIALSPMTAFMATRRLRRLLKRRSQSSRKSR